MNVEVSRKMLGAVFFGGAILLGGGRLSAQECAARVTVRQTSMKPNDDGTRTLRYRATVNADRVANRCTRVAFTVMRSYVKPDGSTVQEGIPVSVDAKEHAVVDGDDTLATSRLVYWWADRVRCEPCPAEAAAAAGKGTRVADRDGHDADRTHGRER